MITMDRSERLPTDRGFHVTWDQVHRDSRALAWRLENDLPPSGEWRAILAITRGGMVPAMIIARELNIRAIDTISIQCYDHQNRGTPKVIKDGNDKFLGKGNDVLVIDDLVDTGATLELVRKIYPKARYCTVYAKPLGKPMVDVYITEVSQDTWIYFPWDMALQYSAPYKSIHGG